MFGRAAWEVAKVLLLIMLAVAVVLVVVGIIVLPPLMTHMYGRS